jgi:hypothetical protein
MLSKRHRRYLPGLDYPAAEPISDAKAFDGSLWASKRERLNGEIIGRVGDPDQHLDDIAFELAIRTGPNAELRASLLQRYGRQYLDDSFERSIENARGEVLAFIPRANKQRSNDT